MFRKVTVSTFIETNIILNSFLSQIFTKFATKLKHKMSKSIEIQVLDKIKRSPRGTLFFVDSFTKITNTKSANKALERLVKSGELERVAQGIY
ncbi:MAG: hypothetical protein EOM12_16340, partial [Verrucomicrobiae bacterium]|nr:hypothetical protein [Verrucomicrobiae bacterium]